MTDPPPEATARWVEASNSQRRPDALVVRNDHGGLIGARSREINKLAVSGRPVELRGNCFSACTLYLRLPNTCVDPNARFGFHGPSWYGAPLPTAQFEHWSNVLASAYREPLRSWFLTNYRYSLNDMSYLRGSDLIQMGYQSC